MGTEGASSGKDAWAKLSGKRTLYRTSLESRLTTGTVGANV